MRGPCLGIEAAFGSSEKYSRSNSTAPICNQAPDGPLRCGRRVAGRTHCKFHPEQTLCFCRPLTPGNDYPGAGRRQVRDIRFAQREASCIQNIVFGMAGRTSSLSAT
jgi:hypothetical protein